MDIVDPLDGGAGITMVSIPAGSFLMGSKLRPLFWVYFSPSGRIDTMWNRERPVHAVTLDAFKMSTTEITQEQYKTVMGNNPSKFSGFYNLPVESVTWEDAATFCNKLSELTGIEPCYDLESWECDFSKEGFRLPTEAEWEYAARAGSSTEYYFGPTGSSLDRAVWYEDNSFSTTHPVGFKEANAAGLYDMSGNVWEWCNDYSSRYNCNSETNPKGGSAAYFLRVKRGGSWASVPDDCRSAARQAGHPRYVNYLTGFRVARR
ncbi:MAG: formylglycine-generating enzyme family protein [Gemmatimonadota bacterium]|nr:formylglycine-generating enzyme family protein [Gemmatimonadota bacterium]